jgi:hypothetical protein
MINNRSKMYRSHKKAIEYLKSLGITKTYIVPHSRFSKDAWSVSDIFFIEKGVIKIAQVQTNAWHSMEKYQKFTDETGIQVLLMLFKDRKDVPSLRVTKLPEG